MYLARCGVIGSLTSRILSVKSSTYTSLHTPDIPLNSANGDFPLVLCDEKLYSYTVSWWRSIHRFSLLTAFESLLLRVWLNLSTCPWLCGCLARLNILQVLSFSHTVLRAAFLNSVPLSQWRIFGAPSVRKFFLNASA
ncbi:hypothetical protein ENBRE01_2596 [Enteropsectra breve]|nr:hypothetical protein ENBRE01_2596 [Enteropsectra breve]